MHVNLFYDFLNRFPRTKANALKRINIQTLNLVKWFIFSNICIIFSTSVWSIIFIFSEDCYSSWNFYTFAYSLSLSFLSSHQILFTSNNMFSQMVDLRKEQCECWIHEWHKCSSISLQVSFIAWKKITLSKGCGWTLFISWKMIPSTTGFSNAE